MEEEVKEFWEEIEWEIQAYIEWVRKRREKEGREIQKYCAVNFITVSPPKGGIRKCAFMKKSHEMGFIKNAMGMTRDYVVCTNGYKDEPDIMQEVFRHVAKKITAKGECKAYAQEVLV